MTDKHRIGQLRRKLLACYSRWLEAGKPCL